VLRITTKTAVLNQGPGAH